MRMSGRKRYARMGGFVIAFLAAVCFLGPAAHGQMFGWRATVVGTSPATSLLPEEIHEHVKSSVNSAVTRIRQQPTSIPVPFALVLTSLLGASLLALLAARGFVFSRAPDNLGRQRLITIGIDRR
ncbi:hypothetical protein MASB_29770 [Mycobacteroides abscessus subsp. bolletii BD]|nr:hypothetical protein MASB_29770 [Mycobacteroides abscessus subsp. bolletii BD]